MLEAQKIHSSLVKTGLQYHVYHCNLLLRAFKERGSLSDARYVLHLMPRPTVVSWNTLLSSYVKLQTIDEALNFFSEIPQKDTRSFNSIISALAHNQRTRDAVNHFVYMTRGSTETRPDHFSYAIMLPLCDLRMGYQIHSRIIKACSNSDVLLWTNLVNMYSEMGEIENAHKCFDEMPERDLVSWNALISCYSNKCGVNDVSLDLFQRMRREGLKWDEFTIATVTNGLTSRSQIPLAKQVHSLIIRSGFCFDRFTVNTLIDLYSKCGNVESAAQILSEIHEADVVSWTTLILGHSHSGNWNEVVHVFNQMRTLGIHPNSFTIAGLFNTCASSNSFERGKEYHSLAIKYGLESDVVVGSAIVNMYSKCGEVKDAKEFFQRMPCRDLVSWNGMICGFAQNGEAVEALNLFHEMVHNEGILPNQVTFTGVLSACSYSGFVQKGRQLFDDMVHVHNIRPSAEHHTCMVDMLARAGLLEEAEAFLMHLPFEPDNVMWGTMLGACKKYGEFVVAKRVAKRLLVLEPENSSTYVLLANLFAGGCEWVEAVGIREAMQEKGARKELARSWVRIRDTVHSFVAGDMYHHQIEEIIEVLQRLRLQMAGRIIGFDSIPS